MTLTFEQIVEHLRAPGGLERLRDSLRSPAQRETIRRCAVVREFDRTLYDNLVAPAVRVSCDTVPSLEEVTGWTEIESAGDDRYRVRDRGQALQGWSDMEQLKEFRAEVIHYCENAGREWLDEKLDQLFALNDATAANFFSALYREADDRFDLARTQALVEMGLEHSGQLDAATQAVIDDHRALLRARSFWKDEYYKSLVYLSRPEIDAFLDTLLGAGGQWIGNLFAKGGRGKTAAIRSLIAGTCVPRRIPVGRIDFGFTEVTSRPTTLLMQILVQFEEQVPGTAFQEVRKELADFESSVSGPLNYDHPDVRTFFNRFATTLREHRGNPPSLLIFDNMEDMILGRADVLGLVNLFAEAQAEAPALRLLFSGRYSLFEPGRVPGIETFRQVVLDHEIEPFDESESRAYLVTRRGLPDSPGIDRIIASADGMPFKLSLFADLIRDDPEVSVDELVADGSVELTYLILRIMRRLDVRLQWVLRYGVVPRKLTLPFLRDVMSRYLPDPTSGTSDLDDPLKGLPEPLQAKVFRLPPEKLDVEALWADLTRYAAEHSWVSVDRAQPEILVFHEEVRRPMRRLLWKNPIFRELHRSAAEHFDRAGHAREVVFHRFQLGQPSAATYWRKAIDNAIAAEQPEEVIGLARAILTDDFLEAEGTVTESKAKELVPRKLLVEAFLAEAFASLRIGRENGTNDPAWRNASLAVNNARVLGAGKMADSLAIVDASTLLNAGDTARAKDLLQHADNRQLGVELLRGQAYALLGNPEASIEALEAARRMTLSTVAFADPPLHLLAWPRRLIEPLIVLTLVDQYVTVGKYDKALAELERTLKRSRNRSESVAEFQVRLAELEIDLCLPAAAMATLDSVSGDEYRVRCQILRAEAELLRFAPLAAIEICDVVAPVTGSSDVVADFGQLARVTQLRARIHAGMMEIVETRNHYERALSFWREAAQRDARDRRGPAACLAAQAATELDEFGDLERTSTLIAQLEKTVDPGDAAAVFMVALLRARSGGGELQHLPPPSTARQRVEVAALRADADELRDALAAVSPPEARLALLSPLRQCGPMQVPKTVAARVLKLLPDPRGRGAMWAAFDKDDRANLAIELVEASRVFHQDADAGALLVWACKRLDNPRRPLLDRTRHAAEIRLGIKNRSRRTTPGRWKKLLAAEHPDFLAVLLYGEAMVQRTERNHDALLTEAMECSKSSEMQAWLARQTRRVQPVDERSLDLELSSTTEVTIAVAMKETRIQVRTKFQNQSMVFQPPPTAQAFGTDAFSRRGEVVSYGAVKRFVSDPREFVKALQDTVIDPRLFDTLTSTGPYDVRLELPDSSWQAFPWELAFDRAWGPEYISGIRSMFRSTRSSPGVPVQLPRRHLKVLVVRRSTRTERFLERGHSRPIEVIYKRVARELRVIEDGPAEKLFDEIRGWQPDLIHLSASLGESRSAGGVFLEFASRDLEMASGAPQSVAPGLLLQAAASHGSTVGTKPVVVLDATSPHGDTETIRQLMLRNVFAAELFTYGVFGAVIATGLFSDPMIAVEIYDSFARDLSRGLGYGDAVRRIRATGPSDPFSDIGAAGTAFFSHSADMEDT